MYRIRFFQVVSALAASERFALTKLLSRPGMIPGMTAVRAGRPDDRAAIAPMLARAFDRDPLIRFLFQKESTFPSQAEAFLGLMFDLRIGGGRVLVTADLGAVSLWTPPGGNVNGEAWVEEQWNTSHAPALDPEEEIRIEDYERLCEEFRPEGDYWYLGVVGVEPTRAGTGLGTAVIRPVLDDADREHLVVHLDTANEANLGFYTGLGFEVVAEATIPNGPQIWGMTREPETTWSELG